MSLWLPLLTRRRQHTGTAPKLIATACLMRRRGVVAAVAMVCTTPTTHVCGNVGCILEASPQRLPLLTRHQQHIDTATTNRHGRCDCIVGIVFAVAIVDTTPTSHGHGCCLTLVRGIDVAVAGVDTAQTTHCHGNCRCMFEALTLRLPLLAQHQQHNDTATTHVDIASLGALQRHRRCGSEL